MHLAGHELRTICLLGDTKVGNFDASLVIDENVASLDVAVNDVAFMKVLQALKDLPDEVLDQCLLKGTIVPQECSN